MLTGLVDMYAKCGEIESSCRVSDGLNMRNVVSWTSMISGYVKNGLNEEGLVVFNRMREALFWVMKLCTTLLSQLAQSSVLYMKGRGYMVV